MVAEYVMLSCTVYSAGHVHTVTQVTASIW